MKVKLGLAALAVFLVLVGTASATLKFNGAFETGDLSQYSLQQFCTAAANDTGVAGASAYSAAGQPTWPVPTEGTYAMRFSAEDNDVLSGGSMVCNSGSGNPRAQIATTNNSSTNNGLPLSGDVWETWSFQDPGGGASGIPSVSGSNWYVMQQDFGNPFTGSPPVAFDVKDAGSGNRFQMDVCHDGCGSVTTAWTGPVYNTSQWYHFTAHKVISTSDSTGYVELWLNGVQQTFADDGYAGAGNTQYHTRTLHSDCTCSGTDGYRMYVNSYRNDSLTTSTVYTYFDNVRWGTTEADVRRAPTVIATGQTAWNTTTTPKTISLNVKKGDVIVVLFSSENGPTQGTITDGTNTYTQRQTSGSGASDGRSELWDAVAASDNASLSVSCARNATSNQFGCAWAQLRNSAGYDAGGVNSGDASNPYDVSVTTSRPHDWTVALDTDDNAVTGAATWSSMSKIEDAWSSTHYGIYSAYKSDVTAAGATSMSVTAPTGQEAWMVGGAYLPSN